MKKFFIRTQVIFVSVILLFTFGMMMAIVMRFNYRWDFTKEKIYSISEPTAEALKQLKQGMVEVLAFYPHDDPAKRDFEIFLKECQLAHPDFKYRFYDPDRVPRLAGEFKVKELYTVIIRYGDHQERIVRPTEERFASALYRLAEPKVKQLCFVTGHGEAALAHEDRNGLRIFRDAVESHNYKVNEIILSRDKVPDTCDVVLVVGPHRDLDKDEWGLLAKTFKEGKGILFLVDPMDPGTGGSFVEFMRNLGIYIGQDVIVDKMSRMVGGDFLVPLVSQYVNEHPITHEFEMPTFFPVARSVAPSTEPVEGIEVVPLAFSGSGSWAETNLVSLEQGEAQFEPETDLSGPICLAVAAEKIEPGLPTGPDDRSVKESGSGGRIVVVGDSDFITNGYIELSGNEAFALQMIQWLSKSDAMISIEPRRPEFKPLILDQGQRFVILVTVLGGFPLLFFLTGALRIFWRRRRG